MKKKKGVQEGFNTLSNALFLSHFFGFFLLP